MSRATAFLPKPAPVDPEAVLLPSNLDAERSTLGAALLYTEAADYIVDRLTPDAYFRRAHAGIFTVIRDLRRDGVVPDAITVKERLGARRLEDAGGASYLAALVDGIPRSTNVRYYCDILRDLQAKRALVDYAQRTLGLVVSGDHSAETIIGDADRRLVDLQNGYVEGRLQSLRDGNGALFKDLEWRLEHKGELTGADTGFVSINELTLGWQPGDLIIGGARPSIGKTTFVMNTAVAAARQLRRDGKPQRVAVFSLEMRRRQLEFRMLSSLSGVGLTRIVGGHLGGADYEKVSMALQMMYDLQIVIDDRTGQNAWDIRAACRRLKAEPEGLDLVIIDYLQLMPGTLERRGATRNEELTDISRRLKVLADEVAAPVIALSQLSRAGKDREDKEPRLEDLRECGAFEQDADLVWFLHRKNHQESGTTRFILRKARNGPTGSVNLTIDRDTVTFTDGGADEATAAATRPEKQGSFRGRF